MKGSGTPMGDLKLKDVINHMYFNRLRISAVDSNDNIETKDFVAFKLDIPSSEAIYKQEYDVSIDLEEVYGDYNVDSMVLCDGVVNIGLYI